MATIQRDGYKIGDVVVVMTDEMFARDPRLTYQNLYAQFMVITEFLPGGWMRGRFSTGQGCQPVYDAHISSVRGQVIVNTFSKD